MLDIVSSCNINISFKTLALYMVYKCTPSGMLLISENKEENLNLNEMNVFSESPRLADHTCLCKRECSF